MDMRLLCIQCDIKTMKRFIITSFCAAASVYCCWVDGMMLCGVVCCSCTMFIRWIVFVFVVLFVILLVSLYNRVISTNELLFVRFNVVRTTTREPLGVILKFELNSNKSPNNSNFRKYSRSGDGSHCIPEHRLDTHNYPFSCMQYAVCVISIS